MRKPVDIWSLLKSPYGLMVVASIFIIVIMPRMKVRVLSRDERGQELDNNHHHHHHHHHHHQNFPKLKGAQRALCSVGQNHIYTVFVG